MEENNKLFIEALKQGDKKVFQQIFDTWYEPLCRFCYFRMGVQEDAEEIVQDIFVKLWVKRNELEIKTSLRSYLYRTALNRIINHQEHLKIRLNHFEYVISANRNDPYQSDGVYEKEIQTLAAMAVRNMPARRRTVYELSRRDGLTYAQIAEKMGISVKTVEAHLSAALEQLRVYLKDYLVPVVISLPIIGDAFLKNLF
jgi:RNA polymerase sigma-70 factor, ECF subfamily